MMGRPQDEEGRSDDEAQHEETVGAFLLARTEGTQGPWKALMGSHSSKFSKSRDGARRPVEKVPVWYALSDVNALSKKEGLRAWYDLSACTKKEGSLSCPVSALEREDGCTGYRRPTEPAWEFAARAGSFAARYGALNDIAGYGDRSRRHMHVVGSKSPNAGGLRDMLGKVWEWTESWASRGLVVVVRGCGWSNDAPFCRAAHRVGKSPGLRGNLLGFRPGRSVP